MDKVEGDLFIERAKQMVDYSAEYLKTLRMREVLPDVQPGYLRPLIPDHAPEEADRWDDVMKDVERVIMPGVTHSQSPQFHAYFPCMTSHPSICADILCSTINCNGAIWSSGPACTELEVIMMDWLGKLLQLPEAFLSSSNGKGGGVIQGSVSESTLLCMLAAKCRAIDRQMQLTTNGHTSPYVIWEKLVVYTSDQAHSSVMRAGLMAGVKVKLVPSDDKCGLRGPALEEAILNDKQQGMIPFMVVATLGTTSTLGFDNLTELGPIAQRECLWFHIDAAYAGSAFICPEFRPLLNGVEYANSFAFNPQKWMLVSFECSTLWVKNSDELTRHFIIDPPYLKANQSKSVMPEYRNWQIPMSRTFRSLKLWFVLRLFGAIQLREHITMHVRLAKQFKVLVNSDPRFEVVYPVVMGLVCFRLKGDDELNSELLNRLNARRLVYLVSTTVRGILMLRFVIGSSFMQLDDVTFAWSEIRSQAEELLCTRYENTNGIPNFIETEDKYTVKKRLCDTETL